MVKNEEDILEQFVRHNLRVLDRLYIFDHGSTDSTTDIIRALVIEGLSLVRVNAASTNFVGYAQQEIMTALMQLCIRDNGVGAYFPMDADEFIHLRIELEALKKEIAGIGPLAFNIPHRNMPYPGDDDGSLHSDIPRSFNLISKWGAFKNSSTKAAVRVDDPELFNRYGVVQGNHKILFNGAVLDIAEHLDCLRYIHVPVRSSEQAFRKFVNGWLSNVLRFGKQTSAGIHWKLLFDLICNEQDLANIDFAKLLEGVYHGPADVGDEFELVDARHLLHYDIRYGHMRQPSLGVIFRSIESDLDIAAREIARLRGR